MTPPPRYSPRAAVIDVGSNTIKILLGEITPHGVRTLLDRTIECRISEGMYADPPQFTDQAMEAAVQAIQELLELARTHSPQSLEIVSTSAVRDAGNRDEFSKRVLDGTGHPLKVLTGLEEAEGIAHGIAQEPSLDPHFPYSVSDLGGGSLEWIFQRDGGVEHLCSMDLGAVRLLHRFLPDPQAPIPAAAKSQIRTHCLDTFQSALPVAPFPLGTTHWGTGGAFTITRLILATAHEISLSEQSPVIHVEDIRRIESELSSLPLAERQTYPGLPASRADILPVALLVLQALAEFTEAASFHHSFCNLRAGRLAHQLLPR